MSDPDNRRKDVQHRDDNDNPSITDTNEVIDSTEALHNQGIKVVIDNSNQTNGENMNNYTYSYQIALQSRYYLINDFFVQHSWMIVILSTI